MIMSLNMHDDGSAISSGLNGLWKKCESLCKPTDGVDEIFSATTCCRYGTYISAHHFELTWLALSSSEGDWALFASFRQSKQRPDT